MAAVDAFGAASKVAPHFSIVSLVPATVFAMSTLALVLARPWTGQLHWDEVAQALREPTFAQLALLGVGILVLALVQHPLQYPLIQLLEGYWGLSRNAVALAERRLESHLQTLDGLHVIASDAEHELRQSPADDSGADVKLRWRWQEAVRLAGRYPVERSDVMPTKLGNILRRHERSAGSPYGLNVAITAPHLLLVGRSEDVAYVRDQRTQLDLTTRMCVTSAFLAVTWALLLLPCGWWLLMVLLPYAMGHMFYRGACSVAEEYGASLATLIDLNRAALYARLGVPLPDSLQQERDRNVVVEAVLGLRQAPDLDLVWPKDAGVLEAGVAGTPTGAPASDPAGGSAEGDPQS